MGADERLQVDGSSPNARWLTDRRTQERENVDVRVLGKVLESDCSAKTRSYGSIRRDTAKGRGKRSPGYPGRLP